MMSVLYALIAGLLLALRIWGEPMVHAALMAPWDTVALATIGFFFTLAAALLADELIRRIYWRGYFRARQSHEAPALLRDLATVLIFVVALSIWLYVDLDFSAAGLFAASGATAVVIGLALQAMILDLFSGLSINLDRSYVIGDWLTVHSQELPGPVYGRVEGISWRCTLLRLEDGRCILLPNRLVTSNPVTNHSRPALPKRLSVDITLDMRVSPDRATRLLLGEAFKAAQANGMHLDPPPSVLLAQVEGDGSRYQIRFYADPEKISPTEACSLMLKALLSAVNRESLPNPVQQLEVSTEPRGLTEDLADRDALASVPLFAKTLSAEQFDMLVSSAQPIHFKEGATLMVQGMEDSTMLVILEGAARVSASSDGVAAARSIAVLAGGDIVGEMSLMTGAPRSATVTALTPLRALEITKGTIERLLADSPELLERFSTILAEREATLRAQTSRPEKWDFVQRDLLGRMRTFFARAFSSSDRMSS